MDDRGARKRAGEKVETTERSVGPSALAAAWPVSIYLVPASPVVSTLLSRLLLSLSPSPSPPFLSHRSMS